MHLGKDVIVCCPASTPRCRWPASLEKRRALVRGVASPYRVEWNGHVHLHFSHSVPKFDADSVSLRNEEAQG